MITYERVSKKPQVAKSLIGMSLAEFENLYAKFEIAHAKRASALQNTRPRKVRRQRDIGAGRKHRYALRDRLLITLFWLRAYTTYKVIGRLFKVDQTTAEHYIKDVLETLTGLKGFHSEYPAADVPRLRSVQEVMDAFPDMRLLMDAKE
jgi:DDE superfamily endonuclease